jgi:hypothetical protein
MKGRDCVKFIGQLVLSSFPDGYFLQKNNSFKAATSSDQMDKLFGNLTDFFFFLFFMQFHNVFVYILLQRLFPTNTNKKYRGVGIYQSVSQKKK